MTLVPFMAVTFFNLPIEPPPHVVLRSVEPAAETVNFETTTPELLQGLASSQPAPGTLLQPIYPAPNDSGSGQHQRSGSNPETVQPSPPPKTPPQSEEQPKESWRDSFWRRYNGRTGGSN
jgi:hypothetical protein